jgi:hypothetical protein
VFFIHFACAGQAITVENTWIKGSKILYIGLENVLILNGKIENIRSVDADKGSVQRRSDSLIVKPAQPGPIQLKIKTKDQDLSFVFNVVYFPMFSLILTDDSSDHKDVRKEDILNAKNIYLKTSKSDIKLFEDYLVTESVLNINDKNFHSAGNNLSPEAKEAISNLKVGGIIKVEQVSAKSKSTGKEIKLRANQTFTIL